MTHAKLIARNDGRDAVRLRYGAKRRGVFMIPLTDRAGAQRRADTMTEVAARLATTEQSDHARLLLERLGAAATEVDAAQLVRIADGLCNGRVVPDQKRMANMQTTFRQLGARWTSGELARTFPDYVKEKRTADVDEARLAREWPGWGSAPGRAGAPMISPTPPPEVLTDVLSRIIATALAAGGLVRRPE